MTTNDHHIHVNKYIISDMCFICLWMKSIWSNINYGFHLFKSGLCIAQDFMACDIMSFREFMSWWSICIKKVYLTSITIVLSMYAIAGVNQPQATALNTGNLNTNSNWRIFYHHWFSHEWCYAIVPHGYTLESGGRVGWLSSKKTL